MSLNKLNRLLPLMRRTSSSGRTIGGQLSERHYWPVRRSSWDPFEEVERSIDRMLRQSDRFFPLMLRSWSPWGQLNRCVPVETTQDGQRLYKIELDLPHFKPEDIVVTVNDRIVTIKAKRETETDGCKQLREYSYQYTLPNEVNIEQVRSLLRNDGLLTIEAPLPQLKEPHQMEIPVQKENTKDDTKK